MKTFASFVWFVSFPSFGSFLSFAMPLSCVSFLTYVCIVCIVCIVRLISFELSFVQNSGLELPLASLFLECRETLMKDHGVYPENLRTYLVT